MQKLKTLDTLFDPDPTYEVFYYRDSSGELRPWDLNETYRRASELQLEEFVPPEIRSYFNSILNLMTFSYYHYGLVAIAAFLATTAVEMALRTRYPLRDGEKIGGRDRRSFNRLLQRAVRDGIIREEEFHWLPDARKRHKQLLEDLERQDGAEVRFNEEPYTSVLLREMPRMRNYFAHPPDSHVLFTFEMSMGIVQPCSDVINQLFRERTDEKERK